jgi:hypothetical protein
MAKEELSAQSGKFIPAKKASSMFLMEELLEDIPAPLITLSDGNYSIETENFDVFFEENPAILTRGASIVFSVPLETDL